MQNHATNGAASKLVQLFLLLLLQLLPIFVLLHDVRTVQCFVLIPQIPTITEYRYNNIMNTRNNDNMNNMIRTIPSSVRQLPLSIMVRKAVSDDNDDSTTTTTTTTRTNESKLISLGYTTEEIQRSQSKNIQQRDELKVQVNLLPDIDSVTLTAIGFGLIAFNFFVLGNMEDGGIAGIVATIINTVSQ